MRVHIPEELRGAFGALIDLAHEASELLDEVPDDEKASRLSDSLSHTAAKLSDLMLAAQDGCAWNP